MKHYVIERYGFIGKKTTINKRTIQEDIRNYTSLCANNTI